VGILDRAQRQQAELTARASALLVRYSDAPLPDPVAWAERVSGEALDPWQQEFMRWEGSDALLNCARQTGKTEVVSLRAAYRARFMGRSVGCLGPTTRQTVRMLRRCKRWLRADNVAFSREAGLEVELVGGGQVQAFPGDRPDVSIRGDTLDDVIVDEASVIKDSLIAAATPTMATRPGRCIVYLSTPKGQRGAFWDAWSGQGWWHKVTVRADDCPRISAAFLERERIRLGPLYPQEYEGEFLAAPGSLFAIEDLRALTDNPAIVDAFPAPGDGRDLW
jgi:hypothetical protein